MRNTQFRDATMGIFLEKTDPGIQHLVHNDNIVCGLIVLEYKIVAELFQYLEILFWIDMTEHIDSHVCVHFGLCNYI